MNNINNFYILSLWNLFETEIVANGAVLPFKNLLSINKFWEIGEVFLNFSTFCWYSDFLCIVGSHIHPYLKKSHTYRSQYNDIHLPVLASLTFQLIYLLNTMFCCLLLAGYRATQSATLACSARLLAIAAARSAPLFSLYYIIPRSPWLNQLFACLLLF